MSGTGIGTASRDCARLLEQGRELVAGLAPEEYGACFDEGTFSSTGAHLRHVIDYLDCLLAGVDARSIDYTARRRCPEIETSREAGLRELARCIEALDKLDPRRERFTVDVRCDEGDPWVGSTLARELGFVASHTVHHFALIRLTLARCGRRTAPEFGVSPSTLAHRARGSRA
ncbi:MAG: DinB family protein [Myxococcota bacterium]